MLPSASLHQKYVYFVSLGFVSLKGNVLRFPQPQDSKNHVICFIPLSLTTENILIRTSLSQFTPKICWFLFPQLTSPPKSLWAVFPSASCLKNYICFVPLSLMPRNILILPSASLHRKYVGFVSLSLVDQ